MTGIILCVNIFHIREILGQLHCGAQRSSRHLAGRFCYRAADRAAEPSNGTTFYLPETQEDNPRM